MRFSISLMITATLIVCMVSPALGGVPVTFKNDQFSENIQTASQEVSGIPLATQPGFVKNEAFGAVFRPADDAYPINFTGVDVVVAKPPNSDTSEAHAVLEFYFHEGCGADPGKTVPDFSLSTYDVFNPITSDFGMPLQGNTAMQFEFDPEDSGGHPPTLNSGCFTVVFRFTQDAADLSAEWGSYQCSQQAWLGMCGCQQIGTLHDQATTAQSNLMHIIYPPGNCDGAPNAWKYAEDIGVTGDFILRVRGTAASGTCTPSCGGKECGSDGCGGSCGDCSGGTVCKNGECVDDTCVTQCDGKDCGPDGCGDFCGECAEGKTCNDSGVCTGGACDPVANCAGKECGDDGCGGVCGLCGNGEACVQGLCSAGCPTQCEGKECGDDGCGGVCGVCAEGTVCVMGHCEGTEVNDEITVLAISPDSGLNDDDVDVSITGSGFKLGVTIKLGATPLNAVQVVSEALISARVPMDMEPGDYMLIVMNSDGGTASLPNAYQVIAPEIGDPSTGCSTGTPIAIPLFLLLALSLLLLALRRRWA
jgi:hypothetical protein